MDGTVRTVTRMDDQYLVATRWDDGTLSEDVWHTDTPPEEGDRVERTDDD